MRKTATADTEDRRSRPPASQKDKPRGLTRAVGFVVLICMLFLASFSSSAQSIMSSSEVGDRTVEVQVRAKPQRVEQPVAAAASSPPDPLVPLTTRAKQAASLWHEVDATVTPPVPLKPLLPVTPALSLPEKCHARANTELEGGVVSWGASNKKRRP